jgi:hypothetical protein
MWTALPRLMKVPSDRAIAYLATAALCAFAILLVIGLIQGALLT